MSYAAKRYFTQTLPFVATCISFSAGNGFIDDWRGPVTGFLCLSVWIYCWLARTSHSRSAKQLGWRYPCNFYFNLNLPAKCMYTRQNETENKLFCTIFKRTQHPPLPWLRSFRTFARRSWAAGPAATKWSSLCPVQHRGKHSTEKIGFCYARMLFDSLLSICSG